MRIREATAADLPFLHSMLDVAAGWREPAPGAAEEEEVDLYLGGWGREGDLSLIAELAAESVGAAWWRSFDPARPGYGFVRAEVPEITLAVAATPRGRGIGRARPFELIARVERDLIPALSLSVEADNGGSSSTAASASSSSPERAAR